MKRSNRLAALVLMACLVGWQASANDLTSRSSTLVSEVTAKLEGLSRWVRGFVAEAAGRLATPQVRRDVDADKGRDSQPRPTDETTCSYGPVASIHPEIDPNG